MGEKIILLELNNETIESMIYIIRGQKVMLDFELAKIYGYETRTFNQQFKNNINKFDEDFRFQLSKNEWDEILMSKKLISSWGENRKLKDLRGHKLLPQNHGLMGKAEEHIHCIHLLNKE